MADLILGTAGHIDHGKTALVKALTGTDTDRLQEERERGITIELGFAELRAGDRRFGVVDVPGHEAFVRAMLAGAAGMDVVLLVVAADEGVMPQTREHLAIVELLAVPRLVVALTKCDLVEPEWLELVESEVLETLESTPYRDAPMVRTSATAGEGMEELTTALIEAGDAVAGDDAEDLTRLPLDRVFTIQGTGTVVTGTLWSGRLVTGERVRILPEDLEARVRSLQAHGQDAGEVRAGGRTAVALVGEGADRGRISRGSSLVTHAAWRPSRMLTVHARMLPDTAWSLTHNQRVHVHLGTAEVLARVALLEESELAAGDVGWIQLRLEAPVVARGGDRLVIRAYSPVTTIGGGRVGESHPPKRTRLAGEERDALDAVLDGEPPAKVAGALALAGWEGVEVDALPVCTGLAPTVVAGTLDRLASDDCVVTPSLAFGPSVRRAAQAAVVEAVDRAHADDPLLHAIPLAAARAGLPGWASPELADAVVASAVEKGILEEVDGGVRRPGHRSERTPEQERASEEIRGLLEAGGLGPPLLDELPATLRARGDFRALVRLLEEEGSVRQVAEGMYVSAAVLEKAESKIRSELGGRSGLGPADFRGVLPVTRKHLIPLLNYFDGRGVTVRGDGGREVPTA